MAAVALLCSLSPQYTTAEPGVFVLPDVCGGIILMGTCYSCREYGVPNDLRAENGNILCGCEDEFSCRVDVLSESDLDQVAAVHGDGVFEDWFE